MGRAARPSRKPTIGLVILSMLLAPRVPSTPGTQAEPAKSVQVAGAAPAAPVPETVPGRRLRSLWTIVTVTLLLLVAFVVGTYVMVRIGRSVVHRPRRRVATDYVDAWARYRLTDEEIQAATGGAAPDAEHNDTDREPDQDRDGQG